MQKDHDAYVNAQKLTAAGWNAGVAAAEALKHAAEMKLALAAADFGLVKDVAINAATQLQIAKSLSQSADLKAIEAAMAARLAQWKQEVSAIPSGDWLDQGDRFFAGWADTLTFGGTTWLRGAMYGDIARRNHQGSMFLVGQIVGIAHTIAIGGAAGWSRASMRGAGREFSHWMPMRMGGARSLWNGNYVPREIHALSDPFRYRFMSIVWKTANPMPGLISQQWTRIPYVYKGTAAGGLYGGISVGLR